MTRDERSSSPSVNSLDPKATSETFSDSECQLSPLAISPESPKTPTRPQLLESKALPLEWILAPEKSRDNLVDRVLARLIQAEAHEPEASLRDDYRQTFIALSFAAKGNAMPFVEASYLMYGLHPDKVYSSIVARRKALLGPAGEVGLASATIPGASPKKPVQSVPGKSAKEQSNA